MKQQKRVISKAIRDFERNRTKLQKNEAVLLKEIKALALKNEHASA